MNNMINLNYMTRAYNMVAKTCVAKQETDKSMADVIREKLNGAPDTARTSGSAYAAKASAQDMTMEEYKRYIYDKISSLPMDPSRMQDNVSIHISEAGFEAMKNDPEYEKWVLDGLRKDFMTYNPWAPICGGQYVVHYIGASPEEYRGEGWYAGYQNGRGKSLFDSKSEDSFWERRRKRHEFFQEQHEKSLEKKALIEKWQQERLWAGDSGFNVSDFDKIAKTHTLDLKAAFRSVNVII